LLAQAADWVPFKGTNDERALGCDATCMSAGSQAVVSGPYKGGGAFYVCRANAHGEGMRAGYNVAANITNCVYGFGGKEEGKSKFDCLCEPKQ
jgi:hypothetical protein